MTTMRASLEGVPVSGRPRIVQRNTFRYSTPHGAEVTRLHMTDIVTKLRNGRVKLDSGGWRTMTTKDRINAYAAPYYVFSDRGVWHVAERRDGFKAAGRQTVFYEGIVLPDAFDNPAKATREEKRQARLKRLLNAYCDKLAKLPALPHPDSGDCWFCAMRDQDGRAWGEASGDTDHLIGHLTERYVHGSLILNAMRDAGFNESGIALAFDGRFFPRERVVRAVRRYFKRRLGLA